MEPIRNIVVPTDFSPLSDAALARASALARLERASIHLVHAVGLPMVATPYDLALPAAMWEEGRHQGEARLDVLRKEVEAQGVASVTADARLGDPVQAIVDTVEAWRADLVVMGTHGEGGMRHMLLGSVAARALRTLDCSVLAVKGSPEQAARPISRILIAVDFSVHSERAVDAGAMLAQRLGAAVDVVHAIDLPWSYAPFTSNFAVDLEERIQAVVSDGLERVRARLAAGEVAATLHSRRGRPWLVIGEVAAQVGAELVVMGTRGQRGLDHVLLGSVAERTLQTAPCSVLTVKVRADRALAPAARA